MKKSVLLLVELAAYIISTTVATEVTSGSPQDVVRDFCEGETFEPVCGQDELIVMKKATYGRMKLGRCVKIDMGYITCSADVTAILDARCSGRRRCSVRVPDLELETTRPCLELKSYLEVSYQCVKVVKAEMSACRASRTVRAPGGEGHLASIMTQETRSGSPDCPWMVEARPGQRLNITLWDFAPTTSTSSDTRFVLPDYCDRYGVIRELPGRQETAVCGGRGRLRNIIMTSSHLVEIVLDRRAMGTYFIVHYQVIGCADPDVTGDVWLKRQSDKAELGCHGNSDITWTLTCGKDGQWTGDSQACPAPGTAAVSGMSMQQADATGIKQGTVIVVIALAALATLATFVVVFIIFRRHITKGAVTCRQPRPIGPKRSIIYDDPHGKYPPISDQGGEVYMRPESTGTAQYQQVMLGGAPGGPLDSMYDPTGSHGHRSDHTYAPPMIDTEAESMYDRRGRTLPSPAVAINNGGVADGTLYGIGSRSAALYGTGRFGGVMPGLRGANKCDCPPQQASVLRPLVPSHNNNDGSVGNRAMDNKYMHVWQMPLPQIP